MSQSMIMFDSLATSNIPRHEKSALMKAYERAMGSRVGHGIRRIRRGHVKEAITCAVEGATSGLVGGTLGFIHAEMGLDTKMGVPLDGVAAAGGYVAAIMFQGEGIASEGGRLIGNTSMGILSFRKTNEWIAEKKKSSGGAVHGELNNGGVTGMEGDSDVSGEDPIVAMARTL